MTEPQDEQTEVENTQPAEPAAQTGTIVAGGTLLINGLVVFGLNINPEQKLYLIGAVSFLAPMIAALWIRLKVWSPASVEKLRERLMGQIQRERAEADKAYGEARAAQAAVSVVQQTIPAAIQGVMGQVMRQVPSEALVAPQAPPPPPPPPVAPPPPPMPPQAPSGISGAMSWRQPVVQPPPANEYWEDEPPRPPRGGAHRYRNEPQEPPAPSRFEDPLDGAGDYRSRSGGW